MIFSRVRACSNAEALTVTGYGRSYQDRVTARDCLRPEQKAEEFRLVSTVSAPPKFARALAERVKRIDCLRNLQFRRRTAMARAETSPTHTPSSRRRFWNFCARRTTSLDLDSSNFVLRVMSSFVLSPRERMLGWTVGLRIVWATADVSAATTTIDASLALMARLQPTA